MLHRDGNNHQNDGAKKHHGVTPRLPVHLGHMHSHLLVSLDTTLLRSNLNPFATYSIVSLLSNSPCCCGVPIRSPGLVAKPHRELILILGQLPGRITCHAVKIINKSIKQSTPATTATKSRCCTATASPLYHNPRLQVHI